MDRSLNPNFGCSWIELPVGVSRSGIPDFTYPCRTGMRWFALLSVAPSATNGWIGPAPAAIGLAFKQVYGCSKEQCSVPILYLDRDRLPSLSWVWLRFPTTSGTMRSSDFCWVIDFRFHPTIYRFRGTQQISLGNTKRLCHHPAATTPTAPTNIGLRRCPPTCPLWMPYGNSLSLDTVAHLRLLLDSPSRVSDFLPDLG